MLTLILKKIYFQSKEERTGMDPRHAPHYLDILMGKKIDPTTIEKI